MDTLVRSNPATFVAFDAVVRRGHDSIMSLTASATAGRSVEPSSSSDWERPGPPPACPSGVVGHGRIDYFAELERLGVEGMVAKRLDSRYLPGQRTDDWTKVKVRRHVHCLVLGYQADSDGLKSLVVATEDDGELRCVGKVGSGLDEVLRAELLAWFEGRHADVPLVDPGDIDAQWLEPGLYCVVAYSERTRSGHLRAPVFVRLVADE